MSSRGDQEFVDRRLDIEVLCPKLLSHGHYYRCKISAEGMYLPETPGLAVGTELDLVFTCPDGEPLRLSCVVERRKGQTGKFLRFVGVDEGKRERLEYVIWPTWDGEDLFDGLVILAGRYGADSLEECLHLTDVLTRCQHRIRRHGGSKH